MTEKSPTLELDQCNPAEMVEVLLSRLKDSELDEFKKSLLIVELNDLLLFFEKHPQSVGMFRTDLIEWRTFLKQSKNFMDGMLDKKIERTRKIIDFVLKKPKPVKITAKQMDQPTYYQILFRPGIRSIREYPIDVEQYGEHNGKIDEIHRLIATLREEIIYAPHTKISRVSKRVMLDILLYIVEICAFDVLDGIGLLKDMRVLIESIVEGEEFRERTKIVSYMSSLTTKLKEKAKGHWTRGCDLKRKMWDDIACIEKNLELQDKPKFDVELLSKSCYLKMEKMNEIVGDGIESPGRSNVEIVEVPTEEDEMKHLEILLSSPELDVPDTTTERQENPIVEARGCEKLNFTAENIYTGVPKMSSHDLLPCGSSTSNVCKTKDAVTIQRQEQLAEDSVTSPVLEWADNIVAKFGYACHCKRSVSVETDESKSQTCISDGVIEDETIFKHKKWPKPNYGVLKTVSVPPVRQDPDKQFVIDLLRVELGDDQEEPGGNAAEELPSHLKPFLGKMRLLKY